MISYVKYDFNDFNRIMGSIREKEPTGSVLVELKSELNSFFKDSVCADVLYTENTDKLFFGMCVMPVIDRDNVYEILQGTDMVRINKYYLELDSKLFLPTLDLTNRELTAILLHEVGHLVKDTVPMDELRKNLDVYLAKEDDNIKISDSIHYRELLVFGIKDTLRKITSLFEREEDEFIADEFVVACGFGNELESAFEKIVKNGFTINKNVTNKFITFAWTLRLYKDVKMRRIPALRSLRRGRELSSSRLEKREIDNAIGRLERIDDDALLETGFNIGGKFSETIRNMKVKGIRSLEEDLYEYSLRSKNTEFQDESLMLIRQINIRIAIIDDYIATEQLEERDKKRWFDLLDKYIKLREEISRKSTYKDRYSRLYIEYPTIGGEKY